MHCQYYITELFDCNDMYCQPSTMTIPRHSLPRQMQNEFLSFLFETEREG